MNAKILIVEDESIVARDLQFTLEDLGYSVPAIASTGETALQKVTEHQPSLILMDIRIKGELDGIDTAKIIAQQYDIPIVFLTAHSDEETLSRAIAIFPYGYVIKPFEERELHTTIQVALYKHQQEQQLKNNARWLRSIINNMEDGVIISEILGKITFINPAAENLIDLPFERVVGQQAAKVLRFADANTRTILENPLEKVLETKQIRHLPPDTSLIRESGEQIYISGSVSPVLEDRDAVCSNKADVNLAGAVMTFRDVTATRLAAKNLHRRAYYDSLTTLPNRDWFTERLWDAIERVKRRQNYMFAVLFLDLDNFKKVNDSLGHSIGDELLIGVARRLPQILRSFDTIARLGGDEFGIILESLTNPDESFKVAQRIQEKLATPFIIEGNTVFTSCSIGVVVDSKQQNIDDLIKDADIAMYRAKERGGRCYEVFDAEMHLQVVEAFRLENELKIAIAHNQLTVYYQPIITLPEQEISGFEALVRWNHPDRGLVSPGEFIPIAEETGLITRVDLWVLREVCQQLLIWQAMGLYPSSTTISVNFSSKHFILPNTVARIKAIFTDIPIDPQRIKLEITETALLENTLSTSSILAELKALGLSLSLDDFGTGYSSLSYLQQFPLDILKIDRCFVRGLDRDSTNATITTALIQIAHQLGLTVIAEGVETADELAFLLQNNCDHIQGYFYSPPLSSLELEQLTI